MTILAMDDNAESIKKLADNLQAAFPQETIAAFGSPLFVLQYAYDHSKEGSGANKRNTKYQFEKIIIYRRKKIMQKHKKLSARILSLALSVTMVTTMLPATVFAAKGGSVALGTSSVGEIKSFDKLEARFIPSKGENEPNHVYGLPVELDTPEEDLQLPDELTAMVARTVTAPAEDETIPDEDTDDTVSDNQPASPSDAKEEVKEEINDEDVPLAPEPEDKETTVTTVEQETISVTWRSDKEYKPDENGKFIYTAELPEGYQLASGVELPQIHVTVGKQQTTCADTAASNILLDKLLALLADQQTMIDEGGSDVTTTDEFKALTAEIDALYIHVDACEICAAQMAEGGAYNEKFYGAQTLETSVCEINGTGYSSLQAALDVVTTGQTIKILSDITQVGGVKKSFKSDTGITVDLNGCSVSITGDATNKDGIRIFNPFGATESITFTDNSGGSPGTLTVIGYDDTSEYGNSGGLYVCNLVISKISVVAKGGACTYSSRGITLSGGDLTITDGAVVTAEGKAASYQSRGIFVDSTDKLIVDNAVLYASSTSESFTTAKCATSIQPEDASGNKLNPNEDPNNPDGWKRLVATYGVIGPSITIGAQSAVLPYGTAGTATYAVTGKDFDSTAFSPAVQWKSGESWSATAPTGITGALGGSGDSRTFTVSTTATVNAGEYEFKIVSGDVESAAAKVKIDKAEYSSKTQNFSVKSDTANSAATVSLPDITGATYGTVTVKTNSGDLISGTPTVSGRTLTMSVASKTDGTTAGLEIPVTAATNYKDFTMTINITAKDKEEVAITGLTAATGLVYNGNSQNGYTGTVTVQDNKVPSNELVYTYTSTDSGTYTSTNAPTNAGAYKLVVSVADSNETYLGAHADILFTISKATVTITADNKSAYVGDAKPALTYTAAGLASGDTLAIVPTVVYESEPDMSKAGSVKIKASGAVVPNTDNYESAITYVDGTLTISNKSSGGGGSSSGQAIWTSTPPKYQGGTKLIGNVRVPDYTVEGSWKKNENGIWTFAGNGGQTYVNTWAPIYNPYADVTKGQSAFDWFMFDASGNMMTGWYTDVNGNTYYLNPNSDNTLGAMQTGWVLIDGKYYYFNEMPDGTRGKLFRNTRTPDGYLVDENGVWDGSAKQ